MQAHALQARRRVEQRRLGHRVVVARASAARPPVPLDGRYDAVLAVDAAYHFDSRADFLQAARRALRPGGRVAWTDLVLARRPTSARARSRVRDWAARVDVPPENVVSQPDYPGHVARTGLSQLGVQWLDREVLAGFGRFAARQVCSHAWRHPAQGWLKIAGSGLGAALMAATGSVRYGLFTATRPPA